LKAHVSKQLKAIQNIYQLPDFVRSAGSVGGVFSQNVKIQKASKRPMRIKQLFHKTNPSAAFSVADKQKKASLDQNNNLRDPFFLSVNDAKFNLCFERKRLKNKKCLTSVFKIVRNRCIPA